MSGTTEASSAVLRHLNQSEDAELVLDLYTRALDYVLLDEGRVPDAAMAAALFADCVPGGDPAVSIKLGADAAGRLIGIADMGFGYPMAQDAYIGLLLLDPAARGQGLGPRMVALLEEMARAKGATRLLVAVLTANPRGLAFWHRIGFVHDRLFPVGADDGARQARVRLVRKVSPAPAA